MTEPMSDERLSELRQQAKDGSLWASEGAELVREIDRLRAELKNWEDTGRDWGRAPRTIAKMEEELAKCAEELAEARHAIPRRPTINDATAPKSPEGWEHNER